MPVPSEVPLSENVTGPVGVPPEVLVTVAVNVTDWPLTDGLSDDASAVALGLTMICVVAPDVVLAA